jgi:hypothetical protein
VKPANSIANTFGEQSDTMRNGMNLLMTLAIILCSFSSIARTGDITGKVTDKDGAPIVTATVVVLKDSTQVLVKADYSAENGSFKIEGIPDGQYVVKVTMAGYEPYSSGKVTVENNGNVTLPEIKLNAKAGTLKEVAVRAQKPFIEVQADKLVVNVENSIVSAGSTALEILSRSPGVRVDQNDNISLKGKQGVNVMIDGKITPMSGADLANMLKSMPANSIDKIELISNPGARYDAGGTAGIINIKTKRDKKQGLNGSATASYGQGVYPKTSVGLNLNYRNKKFSAYLNYNYAYRIWFNNLMLDRRFYDSLGRFQSAYIQDNYAVFDFKNHIANFGADYSLSKKTIVGMNFSGSTNHFDPKADNNSKELGADMETLYYFTTTGRHRNRYFNYSANTNLRHDFDSTGRNLAVDVDYAAFGNNTNQNFVTEYTDPEGAVYQQPYYLKSDLNGLTQVRSVKADYTNPMRNKAKFDVGVKVSYVTADNEPKFFEQVAGEYVLDIKRSNHFIYEENINAAYLNFNKDWDKWSTQIGVRAEQTVAEWEQITTNQKFDTNYTQLFPSLAVQRHLNKNHDLGLALSRRIERPNYQQLNPFKFFIDKTTYREGYPYLVPGFYYGLELSHIYKQRIITAFSASITDNYIVEVIQPSENDTGKVTVQTNKNMDRLYFYGINGSYTIPITKWWNNTTNYNAYYALYTGNIANTNLKNGNVTFTLNTNNAFVLPRDFSMEVGLEYRAREIYAFMDVKPNWMLNAGIQKNLFNKTATVRLNVQDIFWTGYPRARSTYNGYQEDFVAERETRQATISFTYRFGNRSVGPMRRRTGGAEDEKRRAGNA